MRIKKCFKCKRKKEKTGFYKHSLMADGRLGKCKECAKKDVRENYHKRREQYAEYDRKRIRNDFNYIFTHRYSMMTTRTTGRSGRKYHVMGRKIMSKKAFDEWCNDPQNLQSFTRLHDGWKQSGYRRNLCPSIDRIDNKRGYVEDNIQWITCRDNTKKYHSHDKHI